MTKKKTLLTELARLVDEYPTTEWQALVKILESESFGSIVAKISSNVDEVWKSMPKATARKPKHGTSLNRELEGIDEDKRKFLLKIRDSLRVKEVLPDMAELRDFATNAGIKEPLVSKRNQAIDLIIRHLSKKEIVEIQDLLMEVKKGKLDLGEEYLRWVDHILGKKKQPHDA